MARGHDLCEASAGEAGTELGRKVKKVIDGVPMYFVYSGSTPKFLAITRSLERAGLVRARDEAARWSLLWTSQVTPEMLLGLEEHQRINHFPGSEALVAFGGGRLLQFHRGQPGGQKI